MEHAGAFRGVIILLGALIGVLPIVLLFFDYRKRKEIHKPFIYMAVFGFTIAIALPLLLKLCGLWLALITPCAVMGYVLVARSNPEKF